MKKDCDTCRHIGVDYDNMPCSLCVDFDEWESKTNADHIRSMTDEELAKWLDEDIGCCCYCSEDERLENEPLLRGEKCDEQCEKHLLDWLKRPYKE